MERLSVFILNYNGIKAIEAGSLSSIKKAIDVLTDVEVSVIFLDNFSNDGGIEYAKRIFKNITLCSTFKNEGYARGTNIGLQLAWKLYEPDYFLLVDSDNFCCEEAYSRLLEYAHAHPNAAMIQPLVRSWANPDKVLSCGHTFKANGGVAAIRDCDSKVDFDHLESCSISSSLIRTHALREVGLLNEAFEMYYESTDLSFRIRQHGYDCACCLDAVTYNERTDKQVFSNFRKCYLMQRNLFLLWYLHDKDRYLSTLQCWKTKYSEYQEAYLKTPYLSDFSVEAERRGLCDGFRLQEHPSAQYRLIPKIEELQKDDVLLFSVS